MCVFVSVYKCKYMTMRANNLWFFLLKLVTLVYFIHSFYIIQCLWKYLIAVRKRCQICILGAKKNNFPWIRSEPLCMRDPLRPLALSATPPSSKGSRGRA